MKKCHMASLMEVTFLPRNPPYDSPIIRQPVKLAMALKWNTHE
jgi:hypothetical protein